MSKQSELVPELTGSILDVFFSYDPHTGNFYHKTYRGPRTGGPGSVAGSVMSTGYLMIGLPGKRFSLTALCGCG